MEEDVIPRVQSAFEWDVDRPYHRYRDLEYFHPVLRGLHFGGSDAGTASDPERARRPPLPSPATYKITLPRSYDTDRPEPYPMLVLIPADAGFGGARSGGGGTAAVTSRGWHDRTDHVVCELGFNRATWLADVPGANHESFVLETILPRVLASHNVGRISLLGYANGGFGALHMLMRHPHVFHRAAACDAPVLGAFAGVVKPWGVESFPRNGASKISPWHTFGETFEHAEMFAPYSVGTLVTCEYVRRELNGGDENPNDPPRVGLWKGARAAWEMEALREQMDEFDVRHAWSDAFEDEPGAWDSGWLDEALQFIAAR